MSNLIFFARLFGWFSVRHLLKNRWRALAVLMGIALGASVFSGVRLSVRASLASFTKSVDLMTGAADHAVIFPGGRVDETLIAPLLRHPAVETAAPVLTAYVGTENDATPPFLMIGFDAILDRPLRQWEIAPTGGQPADVWLDLLKHPFSVAVSEKLARENNWKIGDRVVIDHSRNRSEFTLSGILATKGLALADDGRIALTDIATFQEFTGILGRVDRIDLKLGPDSDEPVLAAIGGMLPDGTRLVSASDRKETGRQMIGSYALNLSVLSFASLFVGMFLVYSLVALNAASRRRELAILRSTGASPRLVFSLFLCEGAGFGLAGWLVSLPLTGFLVRHLLRGISGTIRTLFVRVHVDRLEVDTWEVLLGLAITLAVSVLAALQPAAEAMKVPPKEALVSSTRTRGGPRVTGTAGFGLLCVALVLPLSSLPGVSGVPLPGYLAIVLLFAGFALLAPLGLRSAGRVLSPVLGRISEPAHLAGRYVQNAGARAAISVGALITAVALFTALVIMIHSFRQTVSAWVGQSVSGDLFVSPRLAELNAYKDPFPDEVVRALEKISRDVDLVPNRRVILKIDGAPCQLEFTDFDPHFRHGAFFWVEGNRESLRNRLIGGEGVIISEVLANHTSLEVGARFRARVGDRDIDLPVLGIVRDYRTRGGVVFADLSVVRPEKGLPVWSSVRIFFRHPPDDPKRALADLRRRIADTCGDGLEMVDGEILRAKILQIFDETFAVTTVLLVIALAVAALGIATTLTVMVLRRTGQLNTLVAVGASAGQIRAMILWEAGIIAAVGECAGFVCGGILSHLLVYVINKQSFGWTFLYQADWPLLAVSFPLILLAAVAAAFPAIRTALAQPPSMALRE